MLTTQQNRWYIQHINKSLRSHGLSIRRDAAEALVRFLHEDKAITPEPKNVTVLKECLAEVAEKLRIHDAASSVVDLERLQAALTVFGDEEKEDGEVLRLLNSLELPRYRFDTVHKAFAPVPRGRLFGSAADKINMMRDRFTLLEQRLLRNELFLPPAVGGPAIGKTRTYTLSPVDGLAGRKGRHTVFGMLTRDQQGRLQIENLSGSIPLDLSSPELQVTGGLFVENSFILAEGDEDNGIFHVTSLGFPPAEKREGSLTVFPHFHFFGVPLRQGAQQQQQQFHRQQPAVFPSAEGPRAALPPDQSRLAVSQAEKLRTREDDMLVVISHLHLDDPECVVRLKKVLEGLRDAEPVAFLLMGNFTRRPVEQIGQLQTYFDALADLLAKDFSELIRKTQFIFVPGPLDVGVGSSLPLFPLPDTVTYRLRQKLGDMARFASNPCRLLYYGQEIVIYRNDCLNQMRSNCILPPKIGEMSLQDHLVKTLLEQSHLCPMSIASQPIFWNYDHALHLYPLPDVLILGDEVDFYKSEFEGCKVFNPGNFARNGTFCVYYPGRGESQKSQVPLCLTAVIDRLPSFSHHHHHRMDVQNKPIYFICGGMD